MDERVLQFRVGVVVLAAVIVTSLLIAVLGKKPDFLQSKYALHVRFPEAPGVSVNTPVRKSGVHIGRVYKVTLEPVGGVILSLHISNEYRLRRNEVCRIASGSLVTGDAIVEFIPMGESDEFLADGDFLNNGQVATDPFRVFVQLANDIQPAIKSIELAGSEITTLSRNLNVAIVNNEDQLQRILQKSENAMDKFQTTMVSMNDVMGDEEIQRQLKRVLGDLPKMFDDAHGTLQEARETLSGLQRMSQKAEQNLDNLKGFTEPLGEQGEELVTGLHTTLNNLSDMVLQIRTFGEALNNSEGTLGRLIHDDEVYQRLSRAAGNIEAAAGRLRPIMDDVRIITDKVARDPGGTVGVKGLLNRSPGGYKTGVWPH